MDLVQLIEECKKNLRLLDNYYIPEEIRIKKIKDFLAKVIAFEYDYNKLLEAELMSVFTVLCNDITKQCNNFILSPSPKIEDARILLFLILSVKRYFIKIEKLPWVLGRKLSFRERLKVRSILRKKLHSLYDFDRKQPVRGTRVRVGLTGSLARGYSDWKLINGGDIPKPTDYGLPREFRKEKSIYQKLDEELALPQKLKPLMSDVDILILNPVIFDSINPAYSEKSWSFKLGEKYPAGVGASEIISKLHQALSGTKIGGIRGRWVNYIIVRDQTGYELYQAERKAEIAKLAAKVGKNIIPKDQLILDEIIH